MSCIRRQTVSIDGRRNHLRYAGSGPPVVLLHQSPQTSATMVALMEELAQDYFVIAPDTPGFGMSELLPVVQPTIMDFASNLAQLLDGVGIDKAIVSGVHTGAEIALAFADQFPQRVAHLVLDGLPVFDLAERATIQANYFEPNPVRWDGSHLIRLWGKLAEQSVFFPWFDQRPEARMDFDQAPAEVSQGYVHDYLYAGEDYRRGYMAAFAFDALPVINRTTVPVNILYREADPLALHAPRLSDVPAQVRVESASMNPAILRARIRELIGQVPATEAVENFCPRPCPSEAFIDHSDDHSDDHTDGQWRVLRWGNGSRQVLVLHEPASSADGVAAFAQSLNDSLGDMCTVLAPDLPGHGETSVVLPAPAGVAAVAEALSRQFIEPGKTLGVIALGGGAAVAAHLTQMHPALPVALHGPICPGAGEQIDPDNYWPELDIDPCGGHLLHLWRRIRQGYLFFPWYENNRVHKVASASGPDPTLLQAALFDALRSGSAGSRLWQAVLNSDISDVLSRAAGCVTVLHGRPESAGVQSSETVPDVQIAAEQHSRWVSNWLAAESV